jgi:RNA polymerase sigma factor (sigma-70 family)
MRPAELTECDDVALIARARDGEGAAYGELMRRHQRAALRVAAVICGSTEEADDIVQEAFVAVHANLASYRATGTVRSWMLRVVANHAKNHVRSSVRRRRRDDRQARLAVRIDEGADEAVERRLEHEALAAALQRLPEPAREVLGCRFVAGLSEIETAEVLGAAVGTVKSRTSRALARLAAELEQAPGTERTGRPR